jgi:hypothetical protein
MCVDITACGVADALLGNYEPCTAWSSPLWFLLTFTGVGIVFYSCIIVPKPFQRMTFFRGSVLTSKWNRESKKRTYAMSVINDCHWWVYPNKYFRIVNEQNEKRPVIDLSKQPLNRGREEGPGFRCTQKVSGGMKKRRACRINSRVCTTKDHESWGQLIIAWIIWIWDVNKILFRLCLWILILRDLW